MNIIAVDDERIALQTLTNAIKEALPEAEVHGFRKSSEVLEFAVNHRCDIAFLDIQMRNMSGLLLAKKLKECNPAINIIFVTGYTEYTGEALSLYVSGYVMKPATKEKILMEMANLRHPVSWATKHRMRVKTFGEFEVFVDHELLHFSSSRAKELFALLIDRQGAGLTTRQISTVLWEEEPYSTYQKNRVQQTIVQLRTTLQKVGCEEVLHKERNQTAIKPDKLVCDYYEFLKGNVQSINAFTGEYMAQYSWAEFTTAFLQEKR